MAPPKDQNSLSLLIAKDINSGALPTGEWLKQIELEERYGASRPAVRRALDLLMARGVIEHKPNRGYYVRSLDLGKIAETRDIRILLETAAAERLIATGEAIDKLYELAQTFATLITGGELIQRYEANLAFHRTMYSLCTNRELAIMIDDVRNRSPAVPAGSWRTQARSEQSAKEHFQMVDALAEGKIDRLKQLITAHIRQIPLAD
ncbi:GntR family transcriptional regulator [Pseudomonas asiatica]|uniref:GntR family transcriptional regulator n=1 Tax=Pseudomonas asiatica TaxID=2219225 RepID=UPI00383AB056